MLILYFEIYYQLRIDFKILYLFFLKKPPLGILFTILQCIPLSFNNYSFTMPQSLTTNLYRYSIISILSVTTASAFSDQSNSFEEVTTIKQSPFQQLVEKLNSNIYEKDLFSQEFDSERLLEININDKAQFYVGKNTIEHSSFIYTAQHNNGVSGSFSMPEFNSRFRTYSIHTDQRENATHNGATEYQATIGIEDSDNRANGLIWDYKPVTSDEEEITLTASYLSGKKVDKNSLEKTHGNASSFTTAMTGLNKTLRLQSEYAQSKYSTKNSKHELTYKENTHRAQHYLISYTPSQPDTKEKQVIWSIGIEKRIIDPEFKTVFNNNLPKDKDITRVYGHYRKGQWSSEASVAYEKNNLDNRLSTTDNIQLGSLAGSYQSKGFYSNTGFLSLFGTPRYTLRYNHLHNTQEKYAQETLSSSSNHNRNQSFNIESRFQHTSWSWFHSMGISSVSDEFDKNIDFNSSRLDFGTQFSVRKNTSIETSIRSHHSQKNISQLTTRELNYKLKLNQAPTPDQLSGFVAIEFNQRDNDVNDSFSEKHRTFILTSDVNKRLLKAKGIYPSIDLSFSASYKKEHNKYNDINKKDYQALLNININWPQQAAATSISN